jgi:hypothetical protein
MQSPAKVFNLSSKVPQPLRPIQPVARGVPAKKSEMRNVFNPFPGEGKTHTQHGHAQNAQFFNVT